MNLKAQRNIPSKNPIQPQTHGPIDKEFQIGLEVEKEHGDNAQLASKITKDHLNHDSTYYSELLGAGLVDEPEAHEIAVQKSNSIKHTETQPLHPAPQKVKGSVGHFINAERKTAPLGGDAIEHFSRKIGSVLNAKMPSAVVISVGKQS